jgi:hypothetical protein
VDDHQRRVFKRMLDEVDAFDGSTSDLARLAKNLRGLIDAADLHERALMDAFWSHFQEIDMELELRTEEWAPAGSANDERLRAGIATFRAWAQSALDDSGSDRS